jgi:hypothetical protein
MPGGEGECVLCGGGEGEGHHQAGEGGQARQPRHQPGRQVQLRAEIGMSSVSAKVTSGNVCYFFT